MSVIVKLNSRDNEGKFLGIKLDSDITHVLCVKGATEAILECSKYYISSDDIGM